MKSVMAHNFSRVPPPEIERSSFDRSHGYKTTFDAGYLVPVFIDEALPGDTFNLRMSAFARLATPLKPFMDNLYMDSFFFAVPYRLVWANWEKFNGAQNNPGDSTSYTVPQMTGPGGGGIAVGSLADYMGLPIGKASVVFNSLFFRAYNLIYNQWFRDENLQNSVVVDTDDGPDTYTDYALLRRGKRHDYFTSCLPWPQKGTAVQIPLGTSAPVIPDLSNPSVSDVPYFRLLGQNTNRYIAGMNINPPDETFLRISGNPGTSANAYAWASNPNATGLVSDLSAATAATINSLRQAFQLQKLYERDARGGTRYTEIVKAHFGVTSPDARLQRPEYLGGGSTPVNIHPVAQTSVAAATPQGNLAGFGTVSVNGHGFTKSFTEHCLIIGLVNVRADLTYQQGLARHWSRRTWFDFYWPALAHIGEQSVLNQEIFCQMTGDDANVFGYQERYAEYRYKPSQLTGLMRSDAAGSLDVWHLSQDFSALPVLNASFIVDDPPVDRVIATPTEPHFLFDSFFSLKCARPMPVYGVPGMMDRF